MKHLLVAAAAAVTLSVPAGTACAQESAWTMRLGPAHVGFSADAAVFVAGNRVPGGSADASSNTTLALEMSRRLAPRWNARFIVGVPPKTTVSGEGALAGAGTLGRVTYGPAAATVTYDLLDAGPVRPYVGAGLNYTIVFRNEDAFIDGLKVRSAFGSVVQAGVEVPIDDRWSVSLDARKIFVKTKATGTLPAMGGAAARADVTLDPLVVFLSVGRRF